MRKLPRPEGDFSSHHEARELWSNILTDVERNSSPIVYKLLEYSDSHKIFGYDPWEEDSFHRLDNLPNKFINDAKAFIAFAKDKGDGFFSSFGRNYTVPEQFRDNPDAIKAICSICCNSFQYASDRIKDDEDIAIAVCVGAHESHMEAIQYASDRLKSNKQFISKCLVESSKRWKKDKNSGYYGVYDWLRYGPIFKKFTVHDMSDFLNLVPHNQMVDIALHYPNEFFKDEAAILELLRRIEEPTKRASIFERCSKSVRSKKEVRGLIDPNDVQRIERDVDSEVADVVNQISAGKIKRFDAIPEAYRIVGDILSQAVKSGWFDSKDDCMVFTASIKEAKDVWENRHELWLEEYENNWFELYSSLPERLQTDEEICVELLESGYPRYEAMLEKVPSLYRSKQALKAILHILDSDYDRQPEEIDFIRRSPFRGDKELMVLACKVEEENIKLANQELFEDRDFVERVTHPAAIARSSAEFQLNNPDLVEAAIEQLRPYSMCCDYWFENTPPEVWSVRSIVMAWVTRNKGWHHGDEQCILKLLCSIDEAHPFLNDNEIVSLSVRDDPSDFNYASNELRSDRTFVLQLVRQTDRILKYADERLRYDDEILIAAISKSEGTIVDCFNILEYQDDKDHLHALSCRIHEKLQLHDVFMRDFLRGIAVSDQHTVHPRLRSPLPMLNQGAETSTRLKKLIAAYADVPICQSYIEMKATAASLNKFGFSS